MIDHKYSWDEVGYLAEWFNDNKSEILDCISNLKYNSITSSDDSHYYWKLADKMEKVYSLLRATNDGDLDSDLWCGLANDLKSDYDRQNFNGEIVIKKVG